MIKAISERAETLSRITKMCPLRKSVCLMLQISLRAWNVASERSIATCNHGSAFA